MSNADRNAWQFPKNVAGKVIGWADDGKRLTNRDVREDVGIVNVKQFSATGDGTTDDTTAIQSALDYVIALSKRPALYFPAGTYLISSNLTVTPSSSKTTGITLRGDGKRKSTILASGSVTKILDFTAADADNRQEGVLVDGLNLDGADVADYGIYAPYCAHSTFRGFRVRNTGTAAVNVGYGFCNVYDDLELTSNDGDGLNLAGAGQNNAVLVTGVKAFLNGGFGIYIADSFGIKVQGCTIEENKKGGIFALGNVLALAVIGNYFEANAEDGHTFTSPATVTIKADIILNGAGASTTISGAFPSSAVVTGNYTAPTVAFSQDAFVYAPGADSIAIDGNSSDSSVGLLAVYGSSTVSPGNGWLQKVNIGPNNVGFSDTMAISPITADVLNYGDRARYIRSVDADQGNLAETDLNRWTAISGSDGTWQRSATTFPGNPDAPVWELVWASSGSSAIMGFSIDTADYPEHAGKLFMFSCWTKHGFSGDGNAVPYVNSVALTSSFSSVTDWTYRCGIFEFPASGTKFFAIRKTGASGTIYIAKPVLCQVGADAEVLMGLQQKRTAFSGPTAPAAGTWKAGDVVWNITPGAGEAAGWVCQSAGAPGSWVPFGQAGALTSIASAPSWVGQIALVSGVTYMAIGTSTAADWKAVTDLQATGVVDPASLALGAATAPATIAVTGAALGDIVKASFSLSLAGVSLHAYVSAADTVSYFLRNDAGANPTDLGSGTLKVRVEK